jgi:hypothetical protein
VRARHRRLEAAAARPCQAASAPGALKRSPRCPGTRLAPHGGPDLDHRFPLTVSAGRAYHGIGGAGSAPGSFDQHDPPDRPGGAGYAGEKLDEFLVAAASSIGDPVFGLPQVVWPEVGHVTKLLLTEVLLPANFRTLRPKVRISARCKRSALAAGMGSRLSIRLAIQRSSEPSLRAALYYPRRRFPPNATFAAHRAAPCDKFVA